MAPPGGVEVTLDKKRVLKYDNLAFVVMEEKTGQTLVETLQRMQSGSLLATTALVWAGLQHHHPDVEFYDVPNMLEPDRLEEIAGAVEKAIEAAYPEGEPEPAKKKRKTKS